MEDTTMGTQIEEEMCVIRVIQIVTKWWVSVRKSDRDRDGCRSTLHTCFQDLRERLEEDHGKCEGTSLSSLNCTCIGLLMICQDSRFRSGTPQRVLTTQVFR
jgi:hypothetical protein